MYFTYLSALFINHLVNHLIMHMYDLLLILAIVVNVIQVVIAKNRSRLFSLFLFFSFHLFIVFSSPFVCCKLVLGILM